MVRQIADDKGRAGRFQPAPAGTEPPRDVFLSAVDEVSAVLVERGYRYARSGPHATLKSGNVTVGPDLPDATHHAGLDARKLLLEVTIGVARLFPERVPVVFDPVPLRRP